MDGYHICQIIRKNLQFREIPIIMLSGKDGLFDKMRGRLAGSTEYLTKPFDSVELVQTVKKHLANWQERAPLHQESVRPRLSGPSGARQGFLTITMPGFLCVDVCVVVLLFVLRVGNLPANRYRDTEYCSCVLHRYEANSGTSKGKCINCSCCRLVEIDTSLG